MSKIYIIGHLKPDTDAVVAPMALKYLYDQADCFGYQDSEAVIPGELNHETTFLFEKFGVSAPRQLSEGDITTTDRFVLADHNEESQRLEGISNDRVIEIVDHHKLNLNLSQPIFVTNKPWGSTCTIIYFLMQQQSVKPDKSLAGLMLAAILSDTVGFKSATTTDKDREMAQELAELAGISDVEGFALEILKAKSDISGLTSEQIVTNDYKIYDFAGQKTMIAQLETVEQELLTTKRQPELLTAMAEVIKTQGLDLMFLAITDVMAVNTVLLLPTDQEAAIASQAFGGQVVNNLLDIGPKMSRKKEIAPPIEQAIGS